MDKVPVILINDRPETCDSYLETCCGVRIVATALSGPDGVRLAAELRGQYAAIIMDVQMPGVFDGIEATRLVCENDPDAFVIMYSNCSRICEGIDAGAAHFVRGSDGEKMKAIIRRINAGTHRRLDEPLEVDLY